MLLDEESEDSDAYVPSDGDEEEVPSTDHGRHNRRRTRERSVSDSDGAGGFAREDIMDDDDVGGGFIPDNEDHLSQDEDDDMGGGFIPDENNHEHDGKEDIGGGFMVENHATTSSPPPQSVPKEKPLELSEPAIVSSQAANQQSQSPNVPLNEQTFGPVLKKNVSPSITRSSSTAKEEETGAPAFRAEEHDGKLAGDLFGLSEAEIAEAAVVEEEFFELRAQGVRPLCKDPTQEKRQEMDDRGEISAGNVLKKDYSELRAQSAEPSSRGPAQCKPEETDGWSGGGGAEIGSPKIPLMGRTAVGEEVGDGEMEVEEEAEEEEEADDDGSLLSADPSDEDAEPEWLA
ncbi:MAG: hypothetical protein Q9203_006296 [Teloschistes exilis]